LILVAATAVMGRPSVFTDTDDYYAQGHDITKALTAFVLRGKPILDFDDIRYRLTHADGGDQEPVHNQNGARSAYYGVCLYLLETYGTLWLVDLAQSLLAAALIRALWRAIAPGAAAWSYFALMAFLAALSTLPVFTAFAMPDVFAGFAAVATVLLMVYPDRFDVWGQAALFAVLAAAMNFHTSNLITCGVLTLASLLGLGWLRAPGGQILRRGATVALAGVLAVAAAGFYAEMIKLRSGDELGHPPFLTARVLADGPGRVYLARACRTKSPWVVCAFKWLPLDDSEDILWSDDPSRGIFNLSEFAVRVQIEHEDARFALASTLSDPLGQGLASLDNWRQQIVNVRLDEPLLNPGFYLHDPYWRTTNLPLLIRSVGARCGRTRGDCAVWFDPEGLAIIDGVVAFAALGVLLLRLRAAGVLALWRARDFDDPLLRAALAAVLLSAAVIVNAGVCGALSGPFPRYQARIIWLLPAAALLFETAVRRFTRASSPNGGLERRREPS